MIRVARFRYQIARDVLKMARDNGDHHVAAICNNVIRSHTLGHKVARADLDLIAEFNDAVRS